MKIELLNERADLADKVGSWFLRVSDFLYATVTGRLVGRFGVGVGYKVGYFFGGVAETFATKHRVSHAVGGKPCAEQFAVGNFRNKTALALHRVDVAVLFQHVVSRLDRNYAYAQFARDSAYRRQAVVRLQFAAQHLRTYLLKKLFVYWLLVSGKYDKFHFFLIVFGLPLSL